MVGKITHFSIELCWEEALKKSYGDFGTNTPIYVAIQESDKNKDWTNVYIGSTKKYVVENLEPKTEYRFRIRFQKMKGEPLSEWSEPTYATTAREPLYSHDIHRALMQGNLEDMETILQTREVMVDVMDSFGFTPLMHAAKLEFFTAMEMLIHYGADVNFKNESGKTALMMVCAAGKLETVKVLRKHKARYDMFDNGGCSPIHWAVDSNNYKLIEWIGEDGGDLNLQDRGKGNWTPLIRCACLHGNRTFALALILGGADIHITDHDGSTALHHAVLRKHEELVILLLQRNANPVQPNRELNTPYDLALALDDRRYIAGIMLPYVEKTRKYQKSSPRKGLTEMSTTDTSQALSVMTASSISVTPSSSVGTQSSQQQLVPGPSGVFY